LSLLLLQNFLIRNWWTFLLVVWTTMKKMCFGIFIRKTLNSHKEANEVSLPDFIRSKNYLFYSFGVCCLFFITSGSSVNQNCTYIRNPSFPMPYADTTQITYTIKKCTTGLYWFCSLKGANINKKKLRKIQG